MTNLTHNRWFHGAVMICLALAATWLLAGFHLLDRLEWAAFDWRTELVRSDKTASDQVAVILIDEAAIETLSPLVGRWPWPRAVHGEVIDFLAQGEPAAIVFDVLFTEEQSGSQGEGSPDDEQLAMSTAGAGNVVHAMQLYQEMEDKGGRAVLNQPLPEEVKIFATPGERVNGNTYSLPFPMLYEAAAGLGVVNVAPDRDGVYRRFPLFYGYQGWQFPSLSVAPLLIADLMTPQQLADRSVIPSDDHGDYLINHYGRFNAYSMSGILASAQALQRGDLENMLIDPAEFQNRVIFIGASAAGLEDLKAMPLGSAEPAVLLHATTAANLLENDILQLTSVAVTQFLVVLFAISCVLAVLSFRHIYTQLSLPMVLAALFVIFDIWAFEHNQLINMTTPLTSGVLATAAAFLYLVFTEGRDKRRVRNMLAQYVSPAVLGKVVDCYEEQLQAEVGSEENLSILFSDIRGFTTLSESLPAAQVVDMLNHYFSEMNEAIFSHDGTIDKFIGDAIMAFWGAPIKDPLHADKAVQSAMEMYQRLKVVNEWLAQQNYPEIQIGIGINSGDVILGNIGSVQKLDYTVIGDNVNLASRLEGLTKQYGATIVISEFTYNQLQQPMPCYILDLVRVKGKQLPIRIYGPILGESPERAEQLAQLSEQAFNAYLACHWDEAIALYSQLPVGLYSAEFIARCENFKASPPDNAWDGVYVMTTK